MYTHIQNEIIFQKQSHNEMQSRTYDQRTGQQTWLHQEPVARYPTIWTRLFYEHYELDFPGAGTKLICLVVCKSPPSLHLGIVTTALISCHRSHEYLKAVHQLCSTGDHLCECVCVCKWTPHIVNIFGVHWFSTLYYSQLCDILSIQVTSLCYFPCIGRLNTPIHNPRTSGKYKNLGHNNNHPLEDSYLLLLTCNFMKKSTRNNTRTWKK